MYVTVGLERFEAMYFKYFVTGTISGDIKHSVLDILSQISDIQVQCNICMDMSNIIVMILRTK